MSYTYEQMIAKARELEAAGQTDDAKRLVELAQSRRNTVGNLALQAGTGVNEGLAQSLGLPVDMMTRIRENLIGEGEVDTLGERIGADIRGAAAGASRGMAETAGLVMGGPADLLGYGPTAVGLPSVPEMARGAWADLTSLIGGVLEPNRADEGAPSEYVAPTPEGRHISTASEFAGGAALMGGPSIANLLRYGVGPGLASETAGQLTEGTPYEPYARIAAALGAPYVTGKAISPMGGADPMRVRLAKDLRARGVKPTAGQTVGSEALRNIEGVTAPTTQQLDDFTTAALRSVGSTASRATDDVLVSARDAIVRQMDDAVAGVSVIPDSRSASMVDDLLRWYDQNVPSGSRAGTAKGIAGEIRAAAASGKPFSLAQLKKWRTDLGRMTTSPDRVTRDTAHGIRRVIDDLTDRALIAAGRNADIPALSDARVKYRNFLAIEDVMGRAGAEKRLGILNPEALRGAVARTQGSEAISMGQGTDLAKLASAGEAVLEKSSPVSFGSIRHDPAVASALRGGSAGVGTFAATGDPLLAAGAGLAGMAAPRVSRGVVNLPPMQAYLANQAVEPNILDKRLINTIAAMLAGQGGQ